ncbi:MAG: HAD family hydrolase [Microgenomates group bacterium]
MSKFKAIGFDWGGVIYGKPSPIFNKQISKVIGVTPEAYRAAHYKHNALTNVKNYSFEKFWPIVLKELGKEDKYEAAMNYFKNRPANQINKSMVRLIERLKKKGYKLGMLSNNTREGGEKIRKSEVAKFFDVILISAEIGHMKPHKEAFNLLAHKLKVKPTELLFIDDTERVFSLSKEIGYYPLPFTSYTKLAKDLKELEII